MKKIAFLIALLPGLGSGASVVKCSDLPGMSFGSEVKIESYYCGGFSCQWLAISICSSSVSLIRSCLGHAPIKSWDSARRNISAFVMVVNRSSELQ
jgi:hypothetical protein